MAPVLFTPVERERLRAALVAAARSDPRITGAALTGSAATGREDRWSDIDLALCLDPDADAQALIGDWTARLDAEGAVAHHDLRQGATVFRVFLLENTLQVDLAFWPAAEFGALGPSFRLLFGTAAERPPLRRPDPAELIGMAWLHALHVRSSVARGRVWQAEYMLSGMRDHVLALACLRHGLAPHQARGIDDLPPAVTKPLRETLARSLEPEELTRAFACTTEAFLGEVERVDRERCARLAGPLRALPA